MRDMRRTTASIITVVLVGAGLSCQSSAFAQARKAAAASPKILLTATIDLLQPPFFGAVEGIMAEGELHIGPFKGKPGKEVPPTGPLAEGLYLGVVRGTWKDLRDAQLVRVDVTEVGDDGIVVARVGRGLDGMIPLGKLILLVRPPRTTTAQLQALPDLVTLEEGPAPQVAAASSTPDVKPGAATTARSDRAARNLAAIAKAFIGYEDAHRCFPPAALIGPDGRAWHSWRVLILPFLDAPAAQAIRSEYSFEEPWDGPQNKRLIDTMPDVYADQPEGKPTDGFTRYAAVTGEGTMFSPDGVAFDPAVKPRVIGRGVRFDEVVDGAATTLMVGTLRSDAKIPWTKPEDVVVTKEPPPLGKEGFFGTPYESEKGTFALFVRVDGGLAGISDTITPDAFRALATIAERDGVGIWETPGAFVVPASGNAGAGDAGAAPQARPGQQMTVVIFEEDGVPKARFSK